MNKIPKYKSKNNMSQPYIKVTKKEALDKSNVINKINLNPNPNINNTKKVLQKKLKYSYKNSIRKFGDDISTKIKNAISPSVTHCHQNRKTLSNAEDKVNNFF